MKLSLHPAIRKLGIKVPYIKLKFRRPAPEEIVATRIAAGLTQEQAAAAVGIEGKKRWSEYETGVRTPDVARWALFLLIVRQHPEWRLKRNKHHHLTRGKS